MDGYIHRSAPKDFPPASGDTQESAVGEQDLSPQDRSQLVDKMRDWACAVSSKEDHDEYLLFATRYLETLIRYSALDQLLSPVRGAPQRANRRH